MLLSKHKTLRQLVAVLETGNLLSLKLFLKNRSNIHLFPGRIFREYLRLAKHDGWRSMSILELFPGLNGSRITLEYLSGCGINTAVEELAYLALLTRAVAPGFIFEIGTFRGRTALNFALNSPEHCKVYTLDLPPDARPARTARTNAADVRIIEHSATGADYYGKDASTKIVQLWGDSTDFDFSSYYGKMDMVFVDGAHDYDAARSDTENALKMVGPNGLVIWHDFANYGDYNDVTRAVLRLVPADHVVQIEHTELAVYRRFSI